MSIRTQIVSAITGLALAINILSMGAAQAADHGDAPLASVQHSADIGDLYAFLDPNDNTRIVVGLTFAGFIVPGEAVNFSVFNDQLEFLLDFETTGNAKPDRVIKVRFSKKTTSAATPQIARISGTGLKRFTAPTTVATLADAPPAPVITTDPRSAIQFFAGEVNDPFFFDIPGFNRFVSSVVGGSPDLTTLQRGRDSFAGYNTLAIAFSIPKSYFGTLKASAANKLGISARIRQRGKQIDRVGIPAVNVALVPFAQKDAYNRANTRKDAAGKFAPGILATLGALGTNQVGQDLLAAVAVQKGDMLRLDLTTANTGAGGGNNAGAGFPNGRRLGDDVIDTILTVVSNGAVTDGDNTGLDAGENPIRDAFPFFPPSIQPFAKGTDDDLTRN